MCRKLTIGIPLYKADRRFYQCLGSAMAQSNVVQEIIICDNGDNYSECEYAIKKDSRIRYIKNIENIGAIKNFIKLFDEAKSRYFAWLGSDDFIAPSFAETVLKAIEKYPTDVAFYGLPTSHSETHGSLPAGRIMVVSEGKDSYDRVLDIFAAHKFASSYYSVMDKQKVSIEPLRIISNFPYTQHSLDYAWLISLAIQGKMRLIPEQIYFYDKTNWNEEYNIAKPVSSASVRIGTGLNYAVSTLLSLNLFLDQVTTDRQIKSSKKIIRSTTNVLQMIISKYIYLYLNKEERKKINLNKSIEDILFFLSKIIDNEEGGGKKLAEDYIKKIIENKPYLLNSLLLLEWRSYLNWIWIKMPDVKLRIHVARSLLQHIYRGNFKFYLYQR